MAARSGRRLSRSASPCSLRPKRRWISTLSARWFAALECHPLLIGARRAKKQKPRLARSGLSDAGEAPLAANLMLAKLPALACEGLLAHALPWGRRSCPDFHHARYKVKLLTGPTAGAAAISHSSERGARTVETTPWAVLPPGAASPPLAAYLHSALCTFAKAGPLTRDERALSPIQTVPRWRGKVACSAYFVCARVRFHFIHPSSKYHRPEPELRLPAQWFPSEPVGASAASIQAR